MFIKYHPSIIITWRFLLLGVLLLPPLHAGSRLRLSANDYQAAVRENGAYHFWLYFIDKEASDPALAKAALGTTRAVTRRRIRGTLQGAELQRINRPVTTDYLRQIEATGATIRRVSRWLNAASVEAAADQIEALTRLDFVRRITPVLRASRPVRPQGAAPQAVRPKVSPWRKSGLDYGASFEQLNQINVPAVHDMGYTGSGILVLMVDTGYYQGHEAVNSSRIVAQYDFLNNDSMTQNEDSTEASDKQHNHGTYTYSVLGGYAPGMLIGPAFEANYLLAKTEDVTEEVQSEEDDYVAALEWGDSLGADLVSSSLGYLDWYNYNDMDGQTAVTTMAVQIATRLGMVVITAAGNQRGRVDGWDGYIIAPADADSVLAVGAVSSTGALASFSSHGPTADGRIKPDVVARGVSVVCAAPNDPGAYTTKNGTSLAAPLVAGSVALILQAHPDWSPGVIWEAVRNSASQADSPDNDFGWGVMNVLAAIQYLPQGIPRQDLPGVPLSLDAVYPNPSTGEGTVVRWTVGQLSPLTVDVYNLLGQHVSTLYHSPGQYPGSASAIWNGLDAAGRPAPSGLYFVRAIAGIEQAVQRLVIHR
ncbi:MAG: S8 family peptidase [Candidatus Marinimicrobia bacterium]|nr:S8 family peptidase [Candidatus Neomarinimicrobiota bacterium]